MAETTDAVIAALRTRVAELEQRLERLGDAEEQVLGARAQAQALLDNIPHMAWMKNAEGVFLAINESFARASASTRQAVLGKTDRDIWPLELAERYVNDDRGVIATGEQLYIEEQIAEASGTKWFETFKTPIHDARGHVIGTVGLARDITERKHAEEQRQLLERRLQETQKLESLGVLAGGIAHDFNNLLVGVLANADLALSALDDDTREARERIADIRDAALRAAELTNQMLAYSGKGHFDVRPVSLSDAVREMSHLLAASISKRAHVTYELASGLPAVRADVAQMQQLVMNLITNASDALGEHMGHIRIRTGAETVAGPVADLYGPEALESGNYVFLEVVDDGCGMDDETRARLFEPFFTTKFTGRGLGLAAVQGIVRGHRGGIVLRTRVGAGTTVKILFPVSDEPLVVSGRSEPGSLREWRGSGLVLLVDDDPRVREVTGLLLRSIGFDVLACATGEEALATFDERAEAIRVVLLDVTMPDVEGDEILHALRARRADVPIVLCSGYSEHDVRGRFGPEARVSFLQKPYPFELLGSRLRELLEPN